MGHVNVAAYGAKFDEANWVLFCEIGLTPSYLRGDRFGMAGVQQNITYKQEAVRRRRDRDPLARAGGCRAAPARRATTCTTSRQGGLVASCELTAVHLDKAAHKACPFPDAIRAAAEALLGGQGLDARLVRALASIAVTILVDVVHLGHLRDGGRA